MTPGQTRAASVLAALLTCGPSIAQGAAAAAPGPAAAPVLVELASPDETVAAASLPRTACEGIGPKLLGEKRYQEAVIELEAALAADPQCHGAHRGLGIAYARLGKHQLASQHFEIYIGTIDEVKQLERTRDPSPLTRAFVGEKLARVQRKYAALRPRLNQQSSMFKDLELKQQKMLEAYAATSNDPAELLTVNRTIDEMELALRLADR